jgi:hypothetical protein
MHRMSESNVGGEEQIILGLNCVRENLWYFPAIYKHKQEWKTMRDRTPDLAFRDQEKPLDI